jgi:hypothetical protein
MAQGVRRRSTTKLTTGKAKEKGIVTDPKMLRYGFDIFSLWIPKIMGRYPAKLKAPDI